MNTLTPSRQSTKNFALARALNSVAGAANAAAQDHTETHHAWGARGVTPSQAARLLEATADQMEAVHAENTQFRVRRLQLEALALAGILASIVVTCAALVLG